jgi:hypothetical protein
LTVSLRPCAAHLRTSTGLPSPPREIEEAGQLSIPAQLRVNGRKSPCGHSASRLECHGETDVGPERFPFDLVNEGSMSEDVDRLIQLGARLVDVRQDSEAIEDPDQFNDNLGPVKRVLRRESACRSATTIKSSLDRQLLLAGHDTLT